MFIDTEIVRRKTCTFITELSQKGIVFIRWLLLAGRSDNLLWRSYWTLVGEKFHSPH